MGCSASIQAPQVGGGATIDKKHSAKIQEIEDEEQVDKYYMFIMQLKLMLCKETTREGYC